MTAIGTALVVGGGTAGAATAIFMARAGIVVELVENCPEVTALGSGIALHGNALRVLDALGVLEACLAQGFPFSTVAIRAPDSRATVLAELESFRTGGPGTTPVGLGVWRIFTSRPAEVTRAELYYGGRCPSAGYTPTSQRSLYAFLYERVQDRRTLNAAEQLAVVRDLASSYRGPWDEIRDGMIDPARIHYAVLESHLLHAPWNRGRTVVIGDAAHAIPPTLAQGAAMALEDAAVLAELLADRDELDHKLWATFGQRRQERVRAILDWSLQLCQWQLNGERGDVAGVTARVTDLVSQPA
jgi:2-polyprenyl-6-methoxyphenol hydroxylase-like FAD-dependent oxidoreductase